MPIQYDRAKAAEAIQASQRAGKPVVSFADALTAYQADHLDHLKAGAARRRQLDRLLSDWLDQPVHKLLQYDAVALFDGKTGATRNRERAALLHLVKWCRQHGYTDLIPEIPKGKEKARDHVIKLEDAQRLWAVSDQLGDWRGLARLLLLTGTRRGDVWHMKPGHVTGDVWTIPETKNGNKHQVWLHPLALSELQLGQRIGEDGKPYYVWNNKGDFSGLKNRWTDLSGVDGWTLHDFRRTIATHLVGNGASEVVIDKLLEHSGSAPSGTTRIYQRAELWDERVAALQLWTGMLTGQTDPTSPLDDF
ncbi:tyrosine-type recombinase/integrase [Roseovarius confluentis]|uniref:tyrosine-type recombinase/integrase n=1 Tax=Roseovarius confluentis TaxID=1852027 RepID=UPI003BAAF60B